MLIVFIRAAILYVSLTFCVRLMGKRTIGELQPAEMVTTVLISNIATLPMEDISMPLIFGLIPIFVIVALEMLLSLGSLHLPFLRKILVGNPVVVIQNGVILQQNLRKLRCTVEDLTASMREAGYFDITEIEYAVAETTGNLSFLPKAQNAPLTAALLHQNKRKTAVPLVLISDGRLQKSTMKRYRVTPEWLDKILKANGVAAKEIFLLTVDQDMQYYLVKRNP